MKHFVCSQDITLNMYVLLVQLFSLSFWFKINKLHDVCLTCLHQMMNGNLKLSFTALNLDRNLMNDIHMLHCCDLINHMILVLNGENFYLLYFSIFNGCSSAFISNFIHFYSYSHRCKVAVRGSQYWKAFISMFKMVDILIRNIVCGHIFGHSHYSIYHITILKIT